MKLANGQQILIKRHVREETHVPVPEDGVKNYAHLTLEVGMLFVYMQSLIKKPDRMKIIPAVKMMLPIMKANTNNAKYPLELLRFLVQQKSLLSQRTAHEVLQACFVNTRGKEHTHVPADQQMEWIVNANKKLVKHMYSNKREDFIRKKSLALYGVGMVAQQFDDVTDTLVRAKKHAKKSVLTDEFTVLDEYERLKPFRHTGGRHHQNYRRITPSKLPMLDGQKFHSWFMEKKLSFTQWVIPQNDLCSIAHECSSLQSIVLVAMESICLWISCPWQAQLSMITTFTDKIVCSWHELS